MPRSRLLILFLLFLPGLGSTQEVIEVHEVMVNHPAFESETPLPFELNEVQVKEQAVFFLDAESVICVDHLCKIVPVRLFWDAYGNYLKYQLAPGVVLEKGDGIPFSADDYVMLAEILKDRSSPYRHLTFYEITHDKVVGEGQVDAISGATIIMLNERETVVGAMWTCFTLWHWAQGGVVREIRSITGARASVSQLSELLGSPDRDKQTFAFTEILSRSVYPRELVSRIVDQIAEGNGEVLSLGIQCLENTEESVYVAAVVQLYGTEKSSLRLVLLRSLLNSKAQTTEAQRCQLIDRLPNNPDYQELDFLLQHIENQESASRKIVHKLLSYLDVNDFLISRRVYYFLSELDVDAVTADRMNKYFERNKDRL